jgi:3-oxoacyl-[acyl-carrier protein] reductase
VLNFLENAAFFMSTLAIIDPDDKNIQTIRRRKMKAPTVNHPGRNFVDMAGRVAIVTGAAQGIGKAVAEALSQCGAAILAIDQMESITRRTAATPANWLGQITDISRFEEIDAAVDLCIEKLGPPDTVINVAAISTPCPVLEMASENWQRNMEVNLHPVYHLARAVLPHMIERKNGCLIHFSSVVASTGGETSAHYAAAKAGVEGFSRSLAREIGPLGIRVNVVAPGMIDTAMLDLMPDSQKEKLVRRIPMKRIGHPADLVGVVLFLASDAAAYITGQTIHVNGGMYMG